MALKTWIGANGGSWSASGNWSPSGSPGIGDDALFSSNSTGASINTTVNCKSLTITGSNVTISGSSALNIYGNITVNSTSVISATGTWSILNTAGQTTYDITSAGRTFNCSLTLNAGTGSTYRLVEAASSANGNFTMGTLRTLTLTTGNLNLDGWNLSVGLFSSSSSNSRSITFSSDQSNSFDLTGVGTVFSLTTSAGWSYTGYSNFRITDGSSSSKTVTTTGMNIYPANFYFSSVGTVTLTSANYFLNLDASAMTGTLSKSSTGSLNIGAGVLLGPNVTSGISGNGVTTFSLVSGLGGSLATGIVDLNGRNWGAMTFSSGAWQTDGQIGSATSTNDVICSGGSLIIAYDFYCDSFTVSGCTVTLAAILTCTDTSTSNTAFAVSSGIFNMAQYGGVICNVVTISGGRLALEAVGYAIDCSRMNLTGSATWQGLDAFNRIRYDGYSSGDVHIKQRTVVSNWSSSSFTQFRYDSSSVNIVVMFTTFDTTSSTVRNISDSSGMFAFCWDTHITLVQRFGISSGSTIGGLDITWIDPSTFEGTSFTCNGSYTDAGPVFRSPGGTITFRGGTSNIPFYFSPRSTDFPWGVTFGNNGYFRLERSSFVQSTRTDSGFAFTMAGCTLESMGDWPSNPVRMYFYSVNLNQSGTNIFISPYTDTDTQFYATGASGTVIVARGSGLTFQGVLSPTFALNSSSTLTRYVYLPSESNYSYSLTQYPACSFSDVAGSTGSIEINDGFYEPAAFLNSITLTGTYVDCSVDMIVQSYAVIATTQSTFFTRSLTVLGIVPAGQQSTFAKGVNNVIFDGIFIGNSTTNATNASLLFTSSSSISDLLTINSGQVTFVPNSTRALLPNLVVNSINSTSTTTLTLLDGTDPGSPTYKPYIGNLTLANTGTINFTAGTVLESNPLNPSSTSTWELGGRTIPKVIVNNNSRMNFTDVNNSGTTYIKEVSAGYVEVLTTPASLSFNTLYVERAGGSASHNYNDSTRVLTFSIYGGGGSIHNQYIVLSYIINVAVGHRVDFSINYSISSEGNYDKGSVSFFIPGAEEGSPEDALAQSPVNGVSGISSNNTRIGTLVGGYQYAVNMLYNKDSSGTAGSDTFSGNITFTTVLTLAQPSYLSFQTGRTFTFDKFFRDPAPYMLYLTSDTSGSQTNLAIPERNLGTLVQGTNPGGVYTATIRDCVVTSTNFIWFAGKNSVDNGNNSGWIFGASPTTQTNIQFFL